MSTNTAQTVEFKPGDTVIFDIDDTICFFTRSFDEWLASRLGVAVPDRNHFPDYDLLGPFRDRLESRETSINVLRDFEASGRIEDPAYMKPTSVIEVVKGLQDTDIDICALTARGWMKNGRRTTQNWLRKLGISMPVHVLGLKDSKAEWINDNFPDERSAYAGRNWSKRPNIHMFEDNPEHIQSITRSCLQARTPIVVDHPHNRYLSPSMFDRVDPNSTEWITHG